MSTGIFICAIIGMVFAFVAFCCVGGLAISTIRYIRNWELFILAGLISALISAVAFTHVVYSNACHITWPESRNPNYDFQAGCIVDHDGQRVPADQIRFLEEK